MKLQDILKDILILPILVTGIGFWLVMVVFEELIGGEEVYKQ